MQTIEVQTVSKIVGAVIDRNIRYIGFDLARGMFASIADELQKGALDVADTDTNSTTE